MTVQMRIAAVRLTEAIQKSPKAAEAVSVAAGIKDIYTDCEQKGDR